MLKRLKRWAVVICLSVMAFLSVDLFLSCCGEERDCRYLWKTDFVLWKTDCSAAIYSFDNDGTDMYGLTIAKSENLEGKILCIPSFLYISGESSVVLFGWEKGTALIAVTVLFFFLVLPKRRKVYEYEEEEEAEEEYEEEEAKEDPYECPNCGEKIFEGLEYCESCGVNIENFRRKLKKKSYR